MKKPHRAAVADRFKSGLADGPLGELLAATVVARTGGSVREHAVLPPSSSPPRGSNPQDLQDLCEDSAPTLRPQTTCTSDIWTGAKRLYPPPGIEQVGVNESSECGTILTGACCRGPIKRNKPHKVRLISFSASPSCRTAQSV